MPKIEILNILLDKFEASAVIKSWKGSRHPLDWKDIEEDYKRTRRDIISYFDSFPKGGPA